VRTPVVGAFAGKMTYNMQSLVFLLLIFTFFDF
jgi:hypothetical protein